MLAVLLLLNAVFNVIVWPSFYRRVAKDTRARDAAGKPTPFLIVHLVLVIIGLTLAAVSALAAILHLAGVS